MRQSMREFRDDQMQECEASRADMVQCGHWLDKRLQENLQRLGTWFSQHDGYRTEKQATGGICTVVDLHIRL